VGTIAATGQPITASGVSNPALVAATTAVVGACFGICSEYGAVLVGRLALRRNGTAAQPG